MLHRETRKNLEIEELMKEISSKQNAVILSAYSGFIEDIEDSVYFVRLYEYLVEEIKVLKEVDEYQAEIECSHFPPCENIELGKIFYLFVTTDSDNNNEEIKILWSNLKWTQEQLDRLKKEAEKLYSLIQN